MSDTPTVGGTYEAAPCDALGKGVEKCGSTLRLWLRPEGLPDRPGWWHVRCVRCDAPFLWRPSSPPAEETWSVILRGEDLARLEELARARTEASPDAFGPMGHRPNVVAEALTLGLRELAQRHAAATAKERP